jgi:uncharacterized membrane protein YadS
MPQGLLLLPLAVLLGVVLGAFLKRSRPRVYKGVVVALVLLVIAGVLLYAFRAR